MKSHILGLKIVTLVVPRRIKRQEKRGHGGTRNDRAVIGASGPVAIGWICGSAKSRHEKTRWPMQEPSGSCCRDARVPRDAHAATPLLSGTRRAGPLYIIEPERNLIGAQPKRSPIRSQRPDRCRRTRAASPSPPAWEYAGWSRCRRRGWRWRPRRASWPRTPRNR